ALHAQSTPATLDGDALERGDALPGLVASNVSRPDGHAPIGVMGDHLHRAGEWMLSFRSMRMDMDGNRDGNSRVSSAEVVSPSGFGFMVSPTEMTMDMHMLGGMYAVTDDLTLMLMVPWIDIEMDHVTRMGGRFTTESSGFGDVGVSALVRAFEAADTSVHFNLGFTAPTGSIDEEDETPASAPAEVVLPYPMQLGSGTWDLRPGMTATHWFDDWSVGGQAIATLRLGRNSRDYSLGDRIDVTAWAAYRATERLSFSARLAFGRIGNVDGADDALNPAVVPTADPSLRAGSRLDALVGVNAALGAGNRLAVEFGRPVLQDLDGPQLETDWLATVGWQLSL
ncbi:MAG: transporter, partial [Planctomycetota bacterium]